MIVHNRPYLMLGGELGNSSVSGLAYMRPIRPVTTDARKHAADACILGSSPAAKDTAWPQTGGIVIQTGEDEFIVAGTGLVVTFNATDKNDIAGILQVDEGEYVEGKWQPGRRMYGDQDHQGRHVRIPVGEREIQHVKLYRCK